MSELWHDFSRDFVGGQIECAGTNAAATEKEPIFLRKPTQFHHIVANWVLAQQAIAVSVNFDGLTRKAIRNQIERESLKCDCVVLTSPSHIERYYLGESPKYAGKVVSVVKVWGDVFHALCQNPRCPEADVHVPIYSLEVGRKKKLTTEEIDETLVCPECRSPRRLQVFFPGYQEKEQQTGDLMRALWRFVAPRIGLIVVAGLSGIWDSALIAFLASLGRDLRDEGVEQPVFCIDPDKDSFLPMELERRGIPVFRIELKAEDVAPFLLSDTTFSDRGTMKWAPPSRLAHTDNLWDGLINADTLYAETPHGYAQVHSPDYLNNFRRLRQLGLKTKLVKLGDTESDHNRFLHSCGASNLAYYWLTTLLDQNKKTFSDTNKGAPHRVILQTLALLGGAHHDLGHLPFTHLAEEVFHELNWTNRPWSRRFKHDERVFETAWKPLVEEARQTLEKAALGMHMLPDDLLKWVQRAIEGRSGLPYLDAILNSPLDVDKIDYVFRDCSVLTRAVHLPYTADARVGWFKNFVCDQQELLPSGLIALSGTSGEHARVFLEDRRWLYKYLYFRPSFRVVERIARSVLTLWLTHCVPQKLSAEMRLSSTQTGPILLSDVRALKGVTAGQLLWEQLQKLNPTEGEPEMILALAENLISEGDGGLPRSHEARQWADSCKRVLERTLVHKKEFDEEEFLHVLKGCASWSLPLYVHLNDLDAVYEIIRMLEVSEPFGAIIDVAVMPRMLAYPSRRRYTSDRGEVMGEMFAVPHFDPDRWGRRTGHWTPLSSSAYADNEDNRWAQLVVVSPREPDDPNVRYTEDRLRHVCQQQGVSLFDEDPDSTGVTKLSGGGVR